MATSEIMIRDVGPITELTLPCPEKGGVVVLRGRNGLGKTTALRAIDAAVSGRGRIEHRDGAVVGTVSAFGITVKAMRNQTRTGELEVQSLEGRFSIADLVDPKIKEAGAADAKRIKTLVQLVGSKADPSLFYKLLAGGPQEFQELVSLKALQADDLVTMAAQIKRDLEGRARDLKEQAAKENVAAESCRRVVVGVDTTLPDDEAKLAEDHLLVLQELQRLRAERKAEQDAAYRQAAARTSLASVEQTYQGLTVDAAERDLEVRAGALDVATRSLAAAEEAVRVAREQHAREQLRHEHALAALKNAREHEAAMEQWRKDLGITVPMSTVTDEQIAEAEADVEAALLAIQTGALVRAAKKQIAAADMHGGEAARLATQSDRLYQAAQNTDVVLSEVVQRLNCPLRVSHGRLVLKTDRSENELFADLSCGEQWAIAIDIAIEAVGPRGVLTVGGEAWASIDPLNQTRIHERLVGTGVVLYAEQCDAGDLRAA